MNQAVKTQIAPDVVLLQALSKVQSAESNRLQAEERANNQLQNDIARAGNGITICAAPDPEKKLDQKIQHNMTYTFEFIQQETNKIIDVITRGKSSLKMLMEDPDIHRNIHYPKDPPEPPVVDDPLSAARSASASVEKYLSNLNKLRDQLIAHFSRERLIKKIIGWSIFVFIIIDVYLVLRAINHW